MTAKVPTDARRLLRPHLVALASLYLAVLFPLEVTLAAVEDTRGGDGWQSFALLGVIFALTSEWTSVDVAANTVAGVLSTLAFVAATAALYRMLLEREQRTSRDCPRTESADLTRTGQPRAGAPRRC